MNRIKFLSKITYTAGILLAMILIISCAMEDDNNLSYICFDSAMQTCTKYELPSKDQKEDHIGFHCSMSTTVIVDKCPSDFKNCRTNKDPGPLNGYVAKSCKP